MRYFKAVKEVSVVIKFSLPSRATSFKLTRPFLNFVAQYEEVF
jgi:hypothetical protein